MKQKNIIYIIVVCVFLAFLNSCTPKKSKQHNTNTEPTLKHKIGQMVMVGFRGTSIDKNSPSPIYSLINEHSLGGVVLYSHDLPSSDSIPRNVASVTQLKTLNNGLQSINSTKLIISIDEEGGFVTRLTKEMGFNEHKSHQKIGEINNLDTTRVWANKMAQELADIGINMNFGPVMDLNLNPENPVIGKRERSFSNKATIVTANSKIFIEEHKKKNIVCTPKHFPGHGSSANDSHKGLADVTSTWKEEELIPYKKLIKENYLDVIMTSHVYNGLLDTLPATLSPKIINGILRKDWGFNKVIISDDMQMRAISNFYNFEESIEKAINAGVDIILISNNAAPCNNQADCKEIPYNPLVALDAINHIISLVKIGRISEERINESYERILSLKSNI